MAPKYGISINTLKTRARRGMLILAKRNGVSEKDYCRFRV
jgi:hypothetical protein